MQDFTELIGRHYELVSIFYRLLGAKVGKRVFWPGHQPVFSGEFDLLEIGDDVVFGSRSVLLCTTADSCEKIILCAGSNVSDNTVVLPGSIIGKNAVLGSNSVCPEGRYLPESSVWFGSRGGEPVMLEKGLDYSPEPVESYQVPPEKVVLQGDESTIRPFGKAIYMGEANYLVLPVSFMILFTAVVQTLVAIVHTLPIIGALNLSAGWIYGYPLRLESFDDYRVTDSEAYSALLVTFIFTSAIRTFVWLSVEVSSKWALMGRRQEGRYNYDQSSYAQNWELYQVIGHMRNVGRMNLLDFISGTPFMSAFFRLLGANVGENCCLYPASGDPYMPEPDLVDMGNNCVIDCASVVCHLNTRGNFELKKITMENNVTLRTRARIQQGVHMEMGSMMLEKSLAMTGEVIDAESVWVGAPAARLVSYDTSSLGSRASMQDVMNNNNVVDTSFV
jgi:acetyltransferase-like isoleucine patch superfamily enzyme